MGPIGKSFRTRLIVGAVIWITAGMGVSWFAVTELLRHRVTAEFESEVDHHATELAAILTIDALGRPVTTQPLSDHRFLGADTGHYWQVERDNGATLRSRSLGSATLPMTLDFAHPGAEQTRTVRGPTGPILMTERIVVAGQELESVRVGVAIDMREFDAVVGELRQTVGLTLGVIAIGLIAAALAQVAYGLRPLGRISQALGAIRRGEARRLPDDLPMEVAPLARGMNDLIEANEAVVRRARVQAGNLAHALKTPLAVLMDEARRLDETGESGAVVLRECERMRRQIEYQLARARAAASSASATAATPIGPALRAIVAALSRLYRDRGLAFDIEAPDDPGIAACETEDLDELLGNLLDNAAKWARSRVLVRLTMTGTADQPLMRIAVEDDGPGIPAEAQTRVFQAGQRLDEQVPGTGLGLAIVRDVAEMYGGRTWIERSVLGGAAVFLELPSPRRGD